MLTKKDQDSYESVLVLLEQENSSPVLGIQILLPQRIEDIFMTPEDSEETILSSRDAFFTDSEFRKLNDFYFFAIQNDIFDLEKTINFSDTFHIENYTVHDLIKIFESSSLGDWKSQSRKFLRYYRIIEGEYEMQTGSPLGFKGLDEPIAYEEYPNQ